jgi:hypothetical protein
MTLTSAPMNKYKQNHIDLKMPIELESTLIQLKSGIKLSEIPEKSFGIVIGDETKSRSRNLKVKFLNKKIAVIPYNQVFFDGRKFCLIATIIKVTIKLLVFKRLAKQTTRLNIGRHYLLQILTLLSKLPDHDTA